MSSISPQSLARTRDKRSLKVPARYQIDVKFPNIGLDVVKEQKKINFSKSSSSAKEAKVQESAPSRSSRSRGSEDTSPKSIGQQCKQPEAPSRKVIPSGSTAKKSDVQTKSKTNLVAEAPSRKIVPSVGSSKKSDVQAKPKTNLVAEAPSSKSILSGGASRKSDGQAKPKTNLVTETQSRKITLSSGAQKKSDVQAKSRPIVVTNKIVPSAGNSKKSDGQPKPKTSLVTEVVQQELPVQAEDKDLVENVDIRDRSQATITTTTLKASNVNTPEDVIKSSPFHPTTVIGNSVRKVYGRQKPLSEVTTEVSSKKASIQEQQAQVVTNLTPNWSGRDPIPLSSLMSLDPISKLKLLPRKKFKGQSLMAKSSQSSPTQLTTNMNPPSTKNFSSLKQIPTGNQNFPKYTSALPPTGMQFGTRLMMNEPIYLPRSVGPIAPITTTFQQIVNESRKPPFISEKIAQCLAFQEKLLFKSMLSDYEALIHMTDYLDVKDLLQLRLSNKSWKSIVDSDIVWAEVRINSDCIRNWEKFGDNILMKYGTKKLLVHDHLPSEEPSKVFGLLARKNLKLEALEFRSINFRQHGYFLRLLFALMLPTDQNDRLISINWKVRILVSDRGIAQVPISRLMKRMVLFEQIPYDPHDVTFFQCDPASEDEIHLVDLSEISRRLTEVIRQAPFPSGYTYRELNIEPI